MSKPVAVIKREIAETRERVLAKARVDVEAEWDRKFAESAQDAEVSRTIVEVNRERRLARQAMETARVSAQSEEDEMAVATTDKKDVTPFSKEAQVGKKRAAATKQIAKTLTKALAKKTAPTSVKSKPVAGIKLNGEHPVHAEYLARAKKEGVRVAAASRGGFKVVIVGTNNRVLAGVWDEPAAAKKAAAAAGLDVKAMPAK